MIRPASLHEVAERCAASLDTPLWKPLCEFLDAFYEPDAERRAMLADEPAAEISPQVAAYLAATAEHLSLIYRLPLPTWTAKPTYFLERACWPEGAGRNTRAIALAESPTSFRRRFIFTEAEPLRRKQGPRHAA